MASHNGIRHNGESPSTILTQLVAADGTTLGFVQDSEVSTFARTYLDDTSGRAVAATLGIPYVLATSGASVSHTGDTNETTLATITVPANALGANGFLWIETLWSASPNDASAKTPRIRYSGASGTQYFAGALASLTGTLAHHTIQNRNATNSQVGAAAGNTGAGGWGSTTGSVVTSAVDTTAATTIVITGTLADGADTITLERYLVVAFYQA